MRTKPITKPRTIYVYGGGQFSFDNPDASDIDIRSIAHALSHICRYTGHCSDFYSVAEHSVLVSKVVPKEFALQGLMHDAHEAYTGDVSSPLKQMLPDYREIEDRVEAAVRRRFGLPIEFDPSVKLADIAVYRAEAAELTADNDKYWHQKAEPANVKINCWSPTRAETAFLRRFEELTNVKESTSVRAQAAPSRKAA
jgi:5'-deoxynucleotidase YfbR-like HD superfamily hydrolase